MRSSSPRPGALQPHFRRDVEIQRQIGAKITEYRVAQRRQHRAVNSPAAALIGLRRQIVTIADHPLAAASAGLITVSTNWTRAA